MTIFNITGHRDNQPNKFIDQFWKQQVRNVFFLS